MTKGEIGTLLVNSCFCFLSNGQNGRLLKHFFASLKLHPVAININYYNLSLALFLKLIIIPFIGERYR